MRFKHRDLARYWKAMESSVSAEHLRRIPSLLAREQAALLWKTRQLIPVSEQVREQLRYLHDYLADFSNPWKISIGHIIPRDPAATSFGDASFTGAGAICRKLGFWFCVQWNSEIQRRVRLPPKHKDAIHINHLEFVTSMLQFAAAVVRLEQSNSSSPVAAFPDGFPPTPILEVRTDNTSTRCWSNRVSASSPNAQSLVRVFAELLRVSDVGCKTDWIAGVDNEEADFLSRLDLTLPPSLLLAQMCQKLPVLPSLDCFLPAPELISLLVSALHCNLLQGPPVLPSPLGRFAAARSIFSNSSTPLAFLTTI
jgi:hypothetical protein